MTDADRLNRAGLLLWGAGWHTPMALALGVNRRTIQRWANGQWPVPGDVWIRLRALLIERAGEARSFAAELKRAA